MQPFFSVVIPTKNRPHYLRQAIQSCLWQTFSDIEVIVSDNFNDEKTKAVAGEFSGDARLKYFRTDREMNMPDHWEWATQKATGKYVMVLPDRKLLFQQALKKLYRCIRHQKEKYNVYVFAVRMFDEEKMRLGYALPRGNKRIFSSRELINNLLNSNYFLPGSYDRFLPKSMNNCYLNEYSVQLRAKYGSYFSNPGVTTPDYSSAWMNLALNDRIYYLNEYLIITQGEHISTGRLFGRGEFDSYLSSLADKRPFEGLPSKLPTTFNMVMNDFLKVRQIVQGHLEKFEVSVVNIYVCNFMDVEQKKRYGTTRQYVASQMEEQFRDELSHLGKKEQHDIQEEIKLLQEKLKQAPEPRISFSNVELHWQDFLYMRFKKSPALTRLFNLSFPNALGAAGFTGPLMRNS